MSASVMNPTSFDYIYKVLVIGSSGVGKTSFLSRYFDNAFDHRPGATVGVDFRHRNFKRYYDNVCSCAVSLFLVFVEMVSECSCRYGTRQAKSATSRSPRLTSAAPWV